MHGMCFARRAIVLAIALGAVTVGALALTAVPASAAACGTGPGTCTQADVNASIDSALAYLDTVQQPNGSWGTTDPGAETALALGAYGVKGYANLSPSEQTQVQNGLNWLLSTQCDAANPTPPGSCGSNDGSFAGDGFLKTYDTGTALIAFSLLSDVPTTRDQATAIADGRGYLISHQVITANGYGPCTPGGTGAQGGNYCGGWDYPCCGNRSDESNTGFALTGLDLTGGVPPDVQANNVGWQRNVQQLCTTSGYPCTDASGFTSGNDGGGAYEPGTDVDSGPSCCNASNANDNGTLTFSYGYDGVPGTDAGVQAAIKMAQDTFDTYETPGAKANRTMVYHLNRDEDGSCDPAVSGCDWVFDNGEGGYHYSIFALVKGLSQYITPGSPTDPTNFYAKAVDLLLGQQCSAGSCSAQGPGLDGSWPADLRDDGSVIGATAFAVLALGRVGAPPDEPITVTGKAVKATEGKSFTGTVATFTDPDTTATASEYTASINWGDGKTSTGTISGGGGNFTVTGTHTYAEEGSFTVTVTVTDTLNSPPTTTSAKSTASVADAALHATAGTPAKSGTTLSGTLATFTDDDPAGTVSDYTASINWGDGTTTSGTISAKSGKFLVSGSHKYGSRGTFAITVTIKDKGGSTATAKLSTTFPPITHGRAKLAGVARHRACVRAPATLHVTGARIASVTWLVNGKKIKGRTVHRGTSYSATIATTPGSHKRVTAKVRFVAASHTAPHTFHATVSGCRPAPRFTG